MTVKWEISLDYDDSKNMALANILADKKLALAQFDEDISQLKKQKPLYKIGDKVIFRDRELSERYRDGVIKNIRFNGLFDCRYLIKTKESAHDSGNICEHWIKLTTLDI